MASVAEVFSQARWFHQTGNFVQAEQLYRHILQVESSNADVWHFLGTACQSQGKFVEAETAFRWALQASPGHANAHNALGIVLAQQGKLQDAAAAFQQMLQYRLNDVDALNNLGNIHFAQQNLDAAIERYRQVLRLKPDRAVTHYNLGVALDQTGRPDEASASYRRALELEPGHLDARNNLGNIFKNEGKLDDALACYRHVLVLKPNFAEVHVNLGLALAERRDWEAAVACYRHALGLKPDYAEAHHSLAIALMEQGRLEEALGFFRQALRLKPNFAEAHNSLGNALDRQEQIDEAIRCFRQALRLRPHFPEAHANLGNVLKRQDKLDEAVLCYEEALRIKPNFVQALCSLGNVRTQQGRFDEALACYDQALRAEPGHAETHFNRGLLLLLLGDEEQGWPEYEWRWQTSAMPHVAFSQPRWDGSPLEGRTILLIAEQGLGDTIQFIRYAPLVKECGGLVVFQSHAPLLRLLENAAGIDHLLPQGVPLPPFDVQAPLLSLPGILRKVSAEVPYLRADSELVERWRRELEPLGGFKIGIAWQGNPSFRADRQRSVPLKHFARLAEVPGVRLVSLQKGPGTDQLSALAGHFPILDLGSRLDETAGPFMDTASIIKNLDLVIASDSAVAHLAGALGVPVWVALSLVPDWRWLLQREDSPWYPTMRLFRQTRQGDWETVFERLAAAVQSLLAVRAN